MNLDTYRWRHLPAIALELVFVPWLLAATCRRLRRTLALVRHDLHNDSRGDRNE